MAETIEAELEALAEDFDVLDDWEDRYRHLIDLGRQLAHLPDALRVDANKVHGCASQVWLAADYDAAGRRIWSGDSDAHLVRGLIAIVLRLYNGRDTEAALAFDARQGLARLGLDQALSTQRSNGLNAMIQRIQRDLAA